jgi:hypothetical protein
MLWTDVPKKSCENRGEFIGLFLYVVIHMTVENEITDEKSHDFSNFLP